MEEDGSGQADEAGATRAELIAQISALRKEIAALREAAFLRQYERPWRLGAYGLLYGLAFGLGSALGASLLVALVVRFLGSIDFIPILGDWAQQIIEQIQLPPR